MSLASSPSLSSSNRARPPDVMIPLGLLLVGAIPIAAGLVRLASVARLSPALDDSARFTSNPWVLVAHIVSSLVYVGVGAFQFSPKLRRDLPRLHVAVGGTIVGAGMVAAISGLLTMVVYPAAPTSGTALNLMRMVSAFGMIACLALGVRVKPRDPLAHGAWMTRAYAIGLAPGTQALMLAPLSAVWGFEAEATFTLGMAAGWAFNVGLAEILVRRHLRRRQSATTPRSKNADATMKAVVFERYGSPDELRLSRVRRPVPGPGQVLVRVEASSLNALDRRMLRADPFLVRLTQGFFRPRHPILGADIAGVIEAVGPGVGRRRVGERVFGESSNEGLGAFAEYVCVKESSLALIPDGLSALEVATLPLAAGTALHAVYERGGVRAGQRVLVFGGGGGVGGFVVQLAKARGAQVTVVCGPRSLVTMKALGADRVLNREEVDPLHGHGPFDVVFGVNGFLPLSSYLALLVPGGTYVMIGGTNRQLFEALLLASWRARLARKHAVVVRIDAAMTAGILSEVRALAEARALKPMVHAVVSLDQLASAMWQLEAGNVQGKIVVEVGRAGEPGASFQELQGSG
jgi:NADPH:quinone reductase-like Zn-dependent oxidoreductase